MPRKRTGPWAVSVVLAIAYVGRAGLCYRQLSWRSTQLGFQFIRLLASSVSCNFWQLQGILREIPRHGMFTLLVNSSPFSMRFVTRTDIMIFFFSVLAVKLHDCSGFWREWYKALVNLISLLCKKLCMTNTVRLGAAGAGCFRDWICNTNMGHTETWTGVCFRLSASTDHARSCNGIYCFKWRILLGRVSFIVQTTNQIFFISLDLFISESSITCYRAIICEVS